MTLREYIIYACPRDALAAQIDHFFATSRATIGPNTAHQYMPHCTLTGFFHDSADAVPRYTTALAAALERARATQPAPVIAITGMLFDPAFHGLTLDSPWLIALIADVAATVDSPTRHDALRRKTWLHLSLAYGFPPEQHAPLKQLACNTIDLHAPVQWELRFYERSAAHDWTCHARWPL